MAPSASDVQAPAVSYEEGSAEKTLLDSARSRLAGDTLRRRNRPAGRGQDQQTTTARP